MQPNNLNSRIMALTICGSLLVGGPAAHATSLMLSLDDLGISGVETIVVDNMPAGTYTPIGESTVADANAAPGLVSFAGQVGSFNTFGATGMSKPNLIAPLLLDLTGLYISGVGTLEIMLTDTDYLLDSQDGRTSLIGAIAGITGGSLEAREWIDLNNQAFGMGLGAGLIGPFDGGPFSATQAIGIEPGPDPFALTKHVTITHSRSSQITSFAMQGRIPEPSTLALMAIGLAGVGVARRRTLAP